MYKRQQLNHVPRDPEDKGDEEEDTADAKDTRGGSQHARDQLIERDDEF